MRFLLQLWRLLIKSYGPSAALVEAEDTAEYIEQAFDAPKLAVEGYQVAVTTKKKLPEITERSISIVS